MTARVVVTEPDREPKLAFVRFYCEKNRMDVAVEDLVYQKRRLIVLRWQSREPMPVPRDWMDQVRGEVEYQRKMDQKRKMGRFVPGG
jgi:hypothetical protein